MKRVVVILATVALLVAAFGVARAERCGARQPCNVRVTSISSTSVSLTWSAPRNMTGFAAYDVRRLDPGDDAYPSVAQETNPPYIDNDVTPGGTYSYRVAQLDASGRVLGISFPLTVTAPLDATPAPTPSPSPTPNTPPPPANVFLTPASIAADCSVDVTVALNNWVASVPNGTAAISNILRFPAGACYRVDGSVGAPYDQNPAGFDRHYLVFEGNGATIDGSFFTPAPYSNRAGIGLKSSSNIVVENFTIKGSHPNPCNLATPDGPCRLLPENGGGFDGRYEWNHGVGIYGGNEITIRGMTILNVYGDGVFLGQDPQTTNTIVETSTISGTGRMAVGLTSNDGIIIRNNVFDRISYHAMDLEPEVTTIANVTIEGNTLRRHYLGFISAVTGLCLPRSNYTIRNNVMEVGGVTTFPPLAFARDAGCTAANAGLTISGNTVLKTDGGAGPPAADNAAVQIRGWGNVTIDDNRIIQARTDAAPVRFSQVGQPVLMRRNNMRENPWAYSYNDVNQSLDLNVQDCGNITSQGPNIPTAC